MHLKIKKGLDVPLSNPPQGEVQDLEKSETVGLDLSLFSNLRLRLLVNEKDSVKIGQPIVEDKVIGQRVFISPASGTIKEIVRGDKRSIKTVVIKVNDNEDHFDLNPIDYGKSSSKDIVQTLHKSGLLAHVVSRPFCRIPNPEKMPKSIFIKALESAPYLPDVKMQLKGYEKEFQTGLDILSKISPEKVHLIHRVEDSDFFSNVKNVNMHSAEGPHPISNPSLHIYMIDPITSTTDTVWTLSVNDVIAIGMFLTSGKYHIDRVVAVAGSGCISEKVGFFKTRMGASLEDLLKGRLVSQSCEIISGDPLTGTATGIGGFLGFFHTCVSAIKKSEKREPFHFFRLGKNKYSAGKTYLSGFLKSKQFDFTTNQHGEHRAFVDGGIYDKVMPMRIPTMQLMKAIIVEDFEAAVELGLLEVAPEDFALPAFICPSKNEMVKIVKEGLKKYSEETGL